MTMWNSLRGIAQIKKHKIPPPHGIGKTEACICNFYTIVSCPDKCFFINQMSKGERGPFLTCLTSHLLTGAGMIVRACMKRNTCAQTHTHTIHVTRDTCTRFTPENLRLRIKGYCASSVTAHLTYNTTSVERR